MTENKSNQQKDKETLQAYAGVGVMFAFLIILFFLTSPGIRGNGDSSGGEILDTEQTQLVEEETEVAVEETEMAVEETEMAVEETEVAVEETEMAENTVESDDTQADSDIASTSYDAESIANGETLFVTCSACHGPDGTGIPGLGKDLVNGEFTLVATDEELANVIINGRPVWDEANTTMIDMPPRGGNPMLSDDDVDDLVAYIRSLGGDATTDEATDDSGATDATTDEATDDSGATDATTDEATDNSGATDATTDEATDDSGATESDTGDDAASTYDAESIANGETLFVTCSACHGPDGTGIPGLGKDLVNGEFTLVATDEELANVIINGRPVWDEANTTMIDMPPRGGNPMLSDDDVDDLVAYIRSLGGDATTDEATDDSGATDATTDEATDDSGDTESDTGDDAASAYDAESIANGETLFVTCSACHGPDGTGIPGLGKDLVNGEFTLVATDEELANVIINGRPVWDEANTTMIDMPPRGGNPMLSDDDVDDLVAYIRSLGGDATTDEATDDSGATDATTDEATDDSGATDATTDEATDDSGDTESDTGDDAASAYDAESIANGETLFVTCSACHGPDGAGIPGLGKDLVNGEFSLVATDEELANVIINGRPVWDEANTTMIDMPPRGGNPMLSDDDVDDLVAYIRSLQTP